MITISTYFSYSSVTLTPFPNKPMFSHVCSTSPLKTPWENEKLLIGNFSFPTVFSTFLENFQPFFIKFRIVICILFELERVINLSFGKDSTHSCIDFISAHPKDIPTKDLSVRLVPEPPGHGSYFLPLSHTRPYKLCRSNNDLIGSSVQLLVDKKRNYVTHPSTFTPYSQF